MLASPRLRYEPVSIDVLDRFHALVQDAHIRRYLMDGEVLPPPWSEERIHDSIRLFAARGIGLSLAFEQSSNELVGFCGFLEPGAAGSEPQLVYALLERFTGRGYASEMARAAIEDARREAGLTTIVAAVDEVNAASVRLLEKLGFKRTDTQPGAFGNLFTYTLPE